jgi:hypothetical protein
MNFLEKVIKKIRAINSRASNIRYELAAKGITISDNERKLLGLRNINQGKRCFIIGNGPSLNQLDLTLLKNEYTFGVNAIYTNYEKMGFYPTYYVVEDFLVAEDRAAEINAYNKSDIKFFGNYLRYCLEPDESTILLNVILDYSDYENFPYFSQNLLQRIWVGGTVSYLCMQIAFYMGFSEVYLVGFDHNYKIPEDVQKQKNHVLVSTSQDVNHFNEAYFGKGKRWHDPMLHRMDKAYRRARMVYEANDRQIFNATEGGKLEVFERVNYASLFENKK